MTVKTSLIPELKVLDFRASLAFYTQLAGFKIVYQRLEEDFAMLANGDARLMVEGLTDKSRTWLVGEMQRPFGRGMHLQIEVGDVNDLYRNFQRVSYPIFSVMEEKWYRIEDTATGQRQFLVQDPDGYLLRFFEKIGVRIATA